LRFAEEGELCDGAVLFGPAGEEGDEVAVGRGEGGEVAEEGVACNRWLDGWGIGRWWWICAFGTGDCFRAC
jgi:hypothetical protein